MNNAVIRKQNLEQKIEDVNNNSLSLEGFFSFLFKDNKEPVKNELSLHELIEKIKEGADISIHSQFKNFHNYYLINIICILKQSVCFNPYLY